MLKKGSKLYSILTGTCPKCQNESMYVDKNPYNLSRIFQMHERCSHCEQKYKIEPSFFMAQCMLVMVSELRLALQLLSSRIFF